MSAIFWLMCAGSGVPSVSESLVIGWFSVMPQAQAGWTSAADLPVAHLLLAATALSAFFLCRQRSCGIAHLLMQRLVSVKGVMTRDAGVKVAHAPLALA